MSDPIDSRKLLDVLETCDGLIEYDPSETAQAVRKVIALIFAGRVTEAETLADEFYDLLKEGEDVTEHPAFKNDFDPDFFDPLLEPVDA